MRSAPRRWSPRRPDTSTPLHGVMYSAAACPCRRRRRGGRACGHPATSGSRTGRPQRRLPHARRGCVVALLRAPEEWRAAGAAGLRGRPWIRPSIVPGGWRAEGGDHRQPDVGNGLPLSQPQGCNQGDAGREDGVAAGLRSPEATSRVRRGQSQSNGQSARVPVGED